jgi:hypothetical protein
MSVSQSERHLLASLAAHQSWANTENKSARTAPARAALDQKFLDAASGDPERAAHLRKAYFKRLALKSVQSRRRAAGLLAEAESAEAELSSLEGGAA